MGSCAWPSRCPISCVITVQSFVQFIAWLPALLLGVFVGAKGFKHMDPVKFRQAVLWILIALAAIGLVKAVFDITAG